MGSLSHIDREIYNMSNVNVIEELKYCWNKGYRFAKIKDHLKSKGYMFEIDEHKVSNFFHQIMDERLENNQVVNL